MKKVGREGEGERRGAREVCASLEDDGIACPSWPRRSADDKLAQNTASLPFTWTWHLTQLLTVSLATREERVGERAMVIAQIQPSTHHLRDVVRRVLGLGEGHQPAEKG